jgi:hypothetical protein
MRRVKCPALSVGMPLISAPRNDLLSRVIRSLIRDEATPDLADPVTK